jgi:carboxyl-terminal processing protease
VKIQQKRAIFGILAATLALGAGGVAMKTAPAPLANSTSALPEFNDAPKVASTKPAGPSGGKAPLVGELLPGATLAGKDGIADGGQIARVLTELLGRIHYAQQPLDDAMSARFLERLLDELDPQRLFFFQTDLAEFDKYRTSLDDLTKQGDVTPAQVIFGRFKERVASQIEFSLAALKSDKFDFTGNDTFVVDRKKSPAPANLEDAKKLWQERVRYEYLQEKLGGQKPEEIVKILTRRYTRLARTIRELDDYDIVERYLDSLAHAYDPHTDYLGKATTEAFNINYIRLSLFGIGAQLQAEDGYTKIMELIPGGPAERGKVLKPGDRIVAVAQGKNGEPVDVVDMKVDKVVEMIRGPKGTTVRLTIIPADATDPATRKVVEIVRDEVKIEEQAAKARIIEMPGANGAPTRIGVVELPTFYQDPDKGKSATDDIALLLKKLEEQKVSGVILDLRRNGGGLLPEAVSLTGLFIKQGPVVQVKDSRGSIRVESDEDASVAYDGPLVVLTSRFSASASEIVTGALQDYGRAIVIGDASTYGKGTVQAVLPLSQVMKQSQLNTSEDPGTIHLTVQKFYRASGASTQLEGVTPDITLPAATDALEIGERYMTFPLPWDTINAATYQKTNRVAPYLAELKKRSNARLSTDKDFAYLREQVERAKKMLAEKTISLNEEKRREDVKASKARQEARKKALAAQAANGEKIYPISLKDARKPGLPKAVTAKELADANKRPRAADPDAEAEEGPDVIETDFHLKEAQRILMDYVSLTKK